MSGWKTWAAVGMIAISGILRYMGMTIEADLLIAIAGGMGLVGLGHKIEKNRRN